MKPLAQDVAVRTLPASLSNDDRRYIQLAEILPRSVDVIEFESCPTLLREQILEHGIVLDYEN